MPQIEPFQGLRYSDSAGDLNDLVAPPYDVIDAEMREQLLAASAQNIVSLILPEEQDGDGEPNSNQPNKYSRAAALLSDWRAGGIFQEEPSKAIYVYHQCFEEAGLEYTRCGFMCRVRIEDFGKGNIFPHEETHGGAKQDRLNLWRACRTNLSQIFGLFPDEANEVQLALEKDLVDATPFEAIDSAGVRNRIFPVTDPETIASVKSLMEGRSVYIADGHHRYETACAYRAEIAEQFGGELPSDHPANFVLMMCVSMSDSGMIVLPTHRLFRGVHPIGSDELAAKLGKHVSAQKIATGPEAANEVSDKISQLNDQSTMALYTAKDQTWTLCQVTEFGKARMTEITSDRSVDWQSLGVSLLHHLIVKDLLQLPESSAPKYVRSIDEVVLGLQEGDSTGRDLTGQIGSGDPFELAAIVMPASLEDIRKVSAHGERMPAKSTYFYPKLLSGLVLNPIG